MPLVAFANAEGGTIAVGLHDGRVDGDTQTAATVRLTLSASDALPAEVKASLPKSALSILDVLRVANRPLGTGQIAELAGVTRPTAGRHLALLRDADLVVWEGTSQRDPRAIWRLA